MQIIKTVPNFPLAQSVSTQNKDTFKVGVPLDLNDGQIEDLKASFEGIEIDTFEEEVPEEKSKSTASKPADKPQSSGPTSPQEGGAA